MRFYQRLLRKIPEYLFNCAASLKKSLYRSGLLATVRAPIPVVSVGNLTAGGTGKTPLVIALAQLLVSRGHRPVLLSRGYRSARPWCLNLVNDGRRTLLPKDVSGDESELIIRRLGDLPVIVCKDRARGALYGAAKLGCTVALLDDAFQYWKLERDADIVVVDATDPFGRQALLPLGRLREPFSMISRAQAAVISRADLPQALPPESIERVIRRYNPECEILFSSHCFEHVLWLPRNQRKPVESLAGQRVFAFCGIGNPESFRQMLQDAGMDLQDFRIFSDHHPYTPEEIGLLMDQAGSLPLVTTAKDYANLTSCLDSPEIGERKYSLCVMELTLRIDMRILENLLERVGVFDGQNTK